MLKKTRKNNCAAIWRLLPWLWLAAAWCAAVAFQWFYGEGYLDSDMASEMVLASLLNEEGGILSSGWYYSTELRVFCQQLLFKAALWIFPHSWHAARTLAQGVLLGATAASALYFFYGAGQRRAGVWLTAAMLCPFGFWYMFHGTYGGFYLVHIIFVLLSMGLMLRLASGGTAAKTALRAVLLALVCLAAGLNGVRLLMNLYIPLLTAAVLALLLRLHEKPLDAVQRPAALPELRLLAAALWAAVCAAIGYGINSGIFAKSYHFKAQESRTWLPLSLSSLLDTWADFLSLFGYQVDDAMYEIGGGVGNVGLFSLPGVLSACGLLLAAGVALAAIRLCWRWRRLGFAQRAVLLLFVSALLIDGAVFAWTYSSQQVNASYWLPLVPLAFALLGIEAETETFRLPQARKCLAVLFCACIIGSSAATAVHFIETPPRANLAMPAAAAWLRDNGYTQGYAAFWQANVLTELTNGDIEMWTVSDLQTLTLYEWLQKTSHAEPPQGRVFVIFDANQDTAALPYYGQPGVEEVYNENGIVILSCASAQQLLALVQGGE